MFVAQTTMPSSCRASTDSDMTVLSTRLSAINLHSVRLFVAGLKFPLKERLYMHEQER
jgi:hypothetical protein